MVVVSAMYLSGRIFEGDMSCVVPEGVVELRVSFPLSSSRHRGWGGCVQGGTLEEERRNCP